MGKFIDLTGKKIEMLEFFERVSRDKNGNIIWKCKCDCGNIKNINGRSVRRGKIKSCGCYNEEFRVNNLINNLPKHGDSANGKTIQLYNSWSGMKSRCHNKNDAKYSVYGGRGIIVCDEWKDYINFKNWAINNGYQEGLTIERINVNGNYEPSNCTWIANAEQNDNKQNTVYLTYNGKTQSLKKWSEETGLNINTMHSRRNYGWSDEKILTTPLLRQNKKLRCFGWQKNTYSGLTFCSRYDILNESKK